MNSLMILSPLTLPGKVDQLEFQTPKVVKFQMVQYLLPKVYPEFLDDIVASDTPTCNFRTDTIPITNRCAVPYRSLVTTDGVSWISWRYCRQWFYLQIRTSKISNTNRCDVLYGSLVIIEFVFWIPLKQIPTSVFVLNIRHLLHLKHRTQTEHCKLCCVISLLSVFLSYKFFII